MRLRQWISSLLIGLLAASLVGCSLAAGQVPQVETVPLSRGDLRVSSRTNGVLQAEQTALLFWKTSGIIESVFVQPGEQVAAGQELARLKQTSLPQPIILAQAELIAARRELENLKISGLQRAQAQQALEQAEQALEDAHNPQLAQAAALETVAVAQQAVDDAHRDYEILTNPPSQAVISQAYASLVLAQNVLDQTQKNLQRLRQKMASAPDLPFIDLKSLFRRAIEGLELKEMQDLRRVQEVQERYDHLLEPVDEIDRAVAETRLARARLELAQAQKELIRQQAGPAPADLAVLEAQVEDARREWLRLKDGPTAQDIAAAAARITSAESMLGLISIRAPFDAVITQVSVDPGDQVRSGALAFRLDTLESMLVLVQVSEMDINRIQVGQPAEVILDSTSGRVYQGHVEEVSVVGNQAGGLVTFALKIHLNDPDEQARPGMTAEVEIITGEQKDVLLVPNRAIRFQGGQRQVQILRDGKPLNVTVKLGEASESYSQLLEGDLKEGDLVIVDPAALSQSSGND